mgnify:CR=1 FL=1
MGLVASLYCNNGLFAATAKLNTLEPGWSQSHNIAMQYIHSQATHS